jgi:hypothetical protein
MKKYFGTQEDIFDECLVEIRAGKQSADQCLMKNPKYRDDFEPLFNLSNRLEQARDLKASAAFRDSTLARFKSASMKKQKANATPYLGNTKAETNHPVNKSRTPLLLVKRGKNNQRWNRLGFSMALAVTLIVIFVLFSSGVVLAANNSLPGGSLYPFKLLIEQTELKLSATDYGDQQLHLNFASRRLTEVDRLLQINRNLYINLALDNYREHLSPVLAQLEAPDLTVEERAQLAKLILRSASLDDVQLRILYLRIPPEQRALIKQAIEDAQAVRDIASQIVGNLPDIRASIENTLESTLRFSSIATALSTSLASQKPGATSTPIPDLANFGYPPSIIPSIGSSEIPFWLTNTPDWSQFGTIYPSIYPTLVSLATNFPWPDGTLQPPVIPTIIYPTIRIPTYQLPTPMPFPPVPSQLPPLQAPPPAPFPQIPTPPVFPTR